MQAQVFASTSKLQLPLVSGDHQHAAGGGAPPPLLSAKAAGKARARPDDDVQRPKPPQTWEQIIKSGVAGGLAACLAKTSVGTVMPSISLGWLEIVLNGRLYSYMQLP